MIPSVLKLAVICAGALLIGCASKPPDAVKLNPDEFVQKKIDAMTKIADVLDAGNPDNRVVDAIEAFRGVPFEPKKQVEAAQKILNIYNARIKSKFQGEAAVDLASDMAVIEREMKSP